MKKMDNKQQKLFILLACVFFSLIGLFMTFFGAAPNKDAGDKGTNKMDKVSTEKKGYSEDAKDQAMGSEDNSTSDTYNIYTNVYFTNTDKLDSCSLPGNAQSALPENAQKFLTLSGYDNVTELVVDDEGFTDNDKIVDFNCSIPEYSEKLGVTYDKGSRELSFAIRKITEVQK